MKTKSIASAVAAIGKISKSPYSSCPPVGIHFLQVQNPNSLFSNDFIFHVVKNNIQALPAQAPERSKPPESAKSAVTEKQILALFNRRDKNKDDRMSKSEALGDMKENFSKYDRNGDGAINRRELWARRKPKS